MFAVTSVDTAKIYYETFRTMQKEPEKPLKVATIFSFAAKRYITASLKREYASENGTELNAIAL